MIVFANRKDARASSMNAESIWEFTRTALSGSLLWVVWKEVKMTRSLSGDLRGRVIAPIEDRVSTREAARRFRIGISTAGGGDRRYRETGETEARKQGQPSHSKLDAHEAFILGLIEEVPDITLAEIGERLAAERGVETATSTARLFLDRRGIRYKKRRRMPQSSSARTFFAAA